MRARRALILSSLAIALNIVLQTSEAAEVSVIPGTETDVPLILVDGEFVLGDEKKFSQIALQYPKAVVTFNSPGGVAYVGVEIGKAIRLKGYWTYVSKNALCASACGYAWLAGIQRYMDADAKVGFHAVYKPENGRNVETGSGNAIVGAYLNTLGLSEDAIYYVTDAGPDGMTWMTYKDASKVGIEVHLADDPNPPNTTPETKSAAVAPSPPPPATSPVPQPVDMGAKPPRQVFEARSMTTRGSTKSGLTANECEASCRMDSSCKGFTYEIWNERCITRDTLGLLRIDPGSKTVIFSDSTPGESSFAPIITRYQNRAFSNTPFRSDPQDSYEECSNSCLTNTTCLGLNFHSTSGQCELFAAPSQFSTTEGIILGIKTQPTDTQ